VCKATYLGFHANFPNSRESLNGRFKKACYETLLSIFVGDIFSWHFHLLMLRELFGEAEIKEMMSKGEEDEKTTLLFDSPGKTISVDFEAN
jgi:hypothetical protein